ncbi:MAG: hypothetical protein U0905_13975 [Pirellulales bacterium]
MSDTKRPKIAPLLLAELVEQVPGRVRKRLDGSPGIAETWIWRQTELIWTVQAHEETVRLESANGTLEKIHQVSCTCLMAPKCFHILACCSCLSLNTDEVQVLSESEDLIATKEAFTSEANSSRPNPMVEVTESMRSAASKVRESLATLLQVGARNAGTLVQSTMLRAGHTCRVSELYALSHTVLRIAEGVQRFRQQSDQASSPLLKEDVASALLACHWIANHANVPRWIIGQARRSFEEIDVRKLNGIMAEPIWTRSGFAGVSVLMQDTAQGDLYTVNELRTGDMSLVHQAYRGGIELGGVTVEAKSLCRSTYTVQELTASSDGRLGKGKTTRWALAKKESTQPFRFGRFSDSVAQQVRAVFAWLDIPEDHRPAGWDLIAFDATVVGALDAKVVVQVDDVTQHWKLGIAIDAPELEFRHNLQLLARCPRLRLRCLVRVKWDEPLSADLMAVHGIAPLPTGDDHNRPLLELPDTWQEVCSFGLDRLERHYIRGIERWSEEIDMESNGHLVNSNAKYTAPLDRRLIGLVLGGRDSVPDLASKSHRRDRLLFSRLMLPTASQLLEDLVHAVRQDSSPDIYKSDSAEGSSRDAVSAFLACDAYFRATNRSLSKSQWGVEESSID